MKHDNKHTAGFTIAEVMILIIFLAAIATVTVYAIRDNAAKQAQVEAAAEAQFKGLKQSDLETLQARLQSGDRAKVALALGMNRTDVEPTLVKRFKESDMTFDLSTIKKIDDDAWTIESDVTNTEGKKERWTVYLTDGDSGLIFFDSALIE